MTSLSDRHQQAVDAPLSRRAIREAERAAQAPAGGEVSSSRRARREAERLAEQAGPAQQSAPVAPQARPAAPVVEAAAAPAPAVSPVRPRGRRAGAVENAAPVAPAVRPSAPADDASPFSRPDARQARPAATRPAPVVARPAAPAARPAVDDAPTAELPLAAVAARNASVPVVLDDVAPVTVALPAAKRPAEAPASAPTKPVARTRALPPAAVVMSRGIDLAPATTPFEAVSEDEIDLPLSFKRNAAAMPSVSRGSSRAAFVRVKRDGGPAKRRGTLVRGAAGVAALGFAASVAVATTLPANAVSETAATSADLVSGVENGQAYSVSGSVAESDLSRDDGYSVATMGTATAFNMANGLQRNDPNAYQNDLTASVQWPFPVGTIISDYYGGRVSPCSGCSSDHKGVDFTPGEGTPIGSIADGRVVSVTPGDNGGLGVHVIVEHVIDGVVYQSVYAHMLVGSIAVQVGDTVSVGDELGKVGNTGSSTGAHLHLEVHQGGTNGTKIDPFKFLQDKNKPETVVAPPEATVSA